MNQKYGKHRLRIFQGRNILIFLLVGYAFYFLYQYRLNDPLVAGTTAPDFKLETLDGQSFNFHEFKIPKALIFFKKNNVYSPYYLDILPQLKALRKKNMFEIIVITNYGKNKEKIEKLLSDKKYKILENITYLANIGKVSDYYGINSFPHFYMVDGTGEIILQSKLPSVQKITNVLRSL